MEDHLIVIDTDIIIDFFTDVAPGSECVDRLISEGNAATTSISVFELYGGVRGKRRLQQLEILIQHLAILPLDVIGAVLAGKIYTQLKLRGQMIGTHDILIAGICQAHAFPLLTRNRVHFSKIKDLRIVSTREILEN